MKPELVEFKDGSYGVLVDRGGGTKPPKFVDLVNYDHIVHKPYQVETLAAGTRAEAQAALDTLLGTQFDTSCEVVK